MKVHLIGLVVAAMFVVFNNRADAEEHKDESTEYLVRGRVVVVDSNEYVIPVRMCNIISHHKRILLRVDSVYFAELPEDFCRKWIVVRCPWYTVVPKDSSMCFRLAVTQKTVPKPLADSVWFVSVSRKTGDTIRKAITRYELQRKGARFSYFLHESNYTQFDLLQVEDCDKMIDN